MIPRTRRFALAAALLIAAAPAALAQAPAPAPVPAPAAAKRLVLETKDGPVTIALRADLAPKHAAQLEALAREGFYDGVVFHRVIEGFMAQTGDPTGTGTGGSKRPNLPAEFSAAPFKRGTVGMARSSSPDSANSQFFICFADSAFLNGQYTVVGEVVSGMEAVDKIKRGAPGSGSVSNPDKIVKMRVADGAK